MTRIHSLGVLTMVLGVGLTTGCLDKDEDTGAVADGGAGDAGSDLEITLAADDVELMKEITTEMSVHGTGTVSDLGDAFEGEVEYATSIDGSTVCDATISLAGTAYTGDCDGCDYAFDITPTIADDSGTAACELDPIYTYVPGDWYDSLQWVYWSETERYSYYYDYDYGGDPDGSGGGTGGGDRPYYYGATYTDVLATGYYAVWDYEYYEYGPDGSYGSGEGRWGPYHRWIVYEGERRSVGDLTWSGLDVDWSVYESRSYFGWDPAYLSYCGDMDYSYATLGFGGTSVFDDVACNEGYYYGYDDSYPDEPGYYGYYGYGSMVGDVWEFDAKAGDTLSVTVDTVSDDTAFMPAVILNGPDSCTEAVAVDNFRCSYGRGAWCPALKTDAGEDGTYRVIVLSVGACAADVGEYELLVDVK